MPFDAPSLIYFLDRHSVSPEFKTQFVLCIRWAYWVRMIENSAAVAMADAQEGNESPVALVQIFKLASSIVSRRSMLGYAYESANG